MSSRVTINLGFYFEKQHYAQIQGYIPRTEALQIPQLMIENEHEEKIEIQVSEPKGEVKSQNKKESDDELSDEDDNNIPNDIELDNEMQNQDENQLDADQQNQVERALEELEEQNYDSEGSDDEDDQEDIDLDSLEGQSPGKGFNSNKTKRQKGQSKDLVQLPDRRPRKDKKLDQATQIIRREEKQKKRKQYLKKQIEAVEKATLQKILNETGRKLRMREQKQMQDVIDREQKVYKTLGNTPKIITLINEDGKTIMIHKTSLFPKAMTKAPAAKMGEVCSNCGRVSKYKLKGFNKFACSLPCYKTVSTK